MPQEKIAAAYRAQAGLQKMAAAAYRSTGGTPVDGCEMGGLHMRGRDSRRWRNGKLTEAQAGIQEMAGANRSPGGTPASPAAAHDHIGQSQGASCGKMAGGTQLKEFHRI